jgi:uncharacterized membrane protein YphA (DoxX/SURF4 family)
VTITFAQGLVGPNGLGYQLNVALIIPSLVIAFLGTGRFSLDELIRRLVAHRSSGQSATPERRTLTNSRS